ncbi:PREDICTED: uncharacterized protein LOC104772581 [Camelina sativa]|uniref:Uncharacterized protein LOC104772581 n=1 Tax=Camelina sativa TaxID=90675 RepID=A0ABM0Y4S2_CAMSA|nr:PREDICTED: uncharacterized protein LOC104772581 [Camelina sativa]
MSSSDPYAYFRSWMDKPRYNEEMGKLTEEFKEGLRQFMLFASNQSITRETGTMSCPCPKCRNYKNLEVSLVKKHLFRDGFMPGYKIWFSHGESESMVDYGSTSQHYIPDSVEEPPIEVDVDAANMSLYDGCKKGHSPLSAATRLMGTKTDWNLSEGCVDAITDFVKEILPENNLSPASYYEVHKLVAGLGLPYQDTSGRVPIPYKRMWYLPLAERLKRLYQSERTVGAMRWHAEHTSDGVIAHPSDAEAQKHFQSVYPGFAYEPRNVYLGLSTDGFNPFGKHGRQYSLWPVIVTPYNLPPSLCMKREFLFLTILDPGPDHPKKSLDVFLQPLIYELQMLWEHGVKAIFQPMLKHGRKTSWFDCHRRWLPEDHPYHWSTTLFKKNKQVVDSPPPEYSGEEILNQLRDFGAEKTAV